MFYSLITKDRFYFRGNSENKASENNHSTGVFPPNLQTLYGAVRGNWIDAYGDYDSFNKGDYEKTIGTINKPGEFSIEGIYLAKNKELYVPIPLDVQVIEETDGSFYAQTLEVHKGFERESDGLKYRLMARENKKSESALGFWIRVKDVEVLFKHERVKCVKLNHFVVPAPKLGIALNKESRTVQESMLYQHTGYYLQDDAELVIEMKLLPDNLDTLKFGNSGTVWFMKESPSYKSQKQKLQNLPANEEDAFIRITLLTAGILSGDLFEEQYYRWNKTSEMIQAVIPRATQLGGWNMEKNAPKPKYPQLAAGTTFFVARESSKPLREQVSEMLKPHTDLLTEAGYGRVYISTSDEVTQ